jgi:reverse gyrase
MILEDKYGCITEWGNYIPYYDEAGRCIKDTPAFEHEISRAYHKKKCGSLTCIIASRLLN